jgi:putative membrane protein
MRKALALGTLAVTMSIAPVNAQQPDPANQRPNPTTQRPDPTQRPDLTQRPEPTTQPRTSSTAQMNPDEQFAKEAAMANMAEIDLGKLAGSKASSSDVKSFAQRMVQDHGKALDELKSLAKIKNITLPTSLDAEHKGMHEKLEPLSGAAFDRAHVEDMVAGHRKVAEKVKTESSTGKDPELKAWAAKVLPTVESHLKMAEGLHSKAVGTAGKK